MFLTTLAAITASPAIAQFTGPSIQGAPVTVAQAQNASIGSYVTLEGNIIAHLRGDYFQFADSTGQMRVEIPSATFGGRQVGPTTRVRLMGEVDRGASGRYVWVKSLTLL
jgi:uncharacterized protein (TIGR00156 family)